jgi:hypothetical protein
VVSGISLRAIVAVRYFPDSQITDLTFTVSAERQEDPNPPLGRAPHTS